MLRVWLVCVACGNLAASAMQKLPGCEVLELAAKRCTLQCARCEQQGHPAQYCCAHQPPLEYHRKWDLHATAAMMGDRCNYHAAPWDPRARQVHDLVALGPLCSVRGGSAWSAE